MIRMGIPRLWPSSFGPWDIRCFMPFLYLMALLSISLGVLNLLPIPVLDGGQLVMLGVEAIRGSPMPEKMENLFYMSGWVAVGFLMIFAVFNDISKFL